MNPNKAYLIYLDKDSSILLSFLINSSQHPPPKSLEKQEAKISKIIKISACIVYVKVVCFFCIHDFYLLDVQMQFCFGTITNCLQNVGTPLVLFFSFLQKYMSQESFLCDLGLQIQLKILLSFIYMQNFPIFLLHKIWHLFGVLFLLLNNAFKLFP